MIFSKKIILILSLFFSLFIIGAFSSVALGVNTSIDCSCYEACYAGSGEEICSGPYGHHACTGAGYLLVHSTCDSLDYSTSYCTGDTVTYVNDDWSCPNYSTCQLDSSLISVDCNIYDSYGSNYCSGNTVVHDFYDSFCSNASCRSAWAGTQQVQDCSALSSGWSCSGGVREYLSYSCSGGSCQESVLVTDYCFNYDGWECSGDIREYRAHSCSGSTCDGYSVLSSEDCSASNGWYNVGAPYSCCDGQLSCSTCQDQEYLDYTCSGGSCGSPSVLNTRTNKTGCAVEPGSCGAPSSPPNGCESNDGYYCNGNTREYQDHYTPPADCSAYTVVSSENCDSSDGCLGGYYYDYSCSGGSCGSSSACTEACCDANYSDPEAYCSNGLCYFPPGEPGEPEPPTSYSLTVSKSGSGTVTGPGVICGSDCSETYPVNASVSLAASPSSEWSFAGWSGACSGTGSCSLIMNSNKSVTATFIGGGDGDGDGGGGNYPPSKPGIPSEYQPDGISSDNCAFAGQSTPTFNWTYSDPDGDPQAAYEIELDDNSGYQTPKFNHLVNAASTSYVLNLSDDDDPPNPGGDWISQLNWNATYFWRVRVKDARGAWSDWSNSKQFKTDKHASPWVDYTWTPPEPTQRETVEFDSSATQSFGGTLNYLWTIISGAGSFVDGTTSATSSPRIQFTAINNTLRLEVTDTDNLSCYKDKDVIVQLPLPEYKEIPPFIWLERIMAGIIDFFSKFAKI